MKIELEFAELHNPLFLNGTNLGMKLTPALKGGLKIAYDRTEKELLVQFNGKTAIVPVSNVSSMTPVAKAAQAPVEQPKSIQQPTSIEQEMDFKASVERQKMEAMKLKQAAPLKAMPTKSAQVGGPADHVFKEGPGKVRD